MQKRKHRILSMVLIVAMTAAMVDGLGGCGKKNGDELTIPAPPVSFGSFKPDAATLAPHLGADSREILLSLGYSNEQIDAMRDAGTVNTHEG